MYEPRYVFTELDRGFRIDGRDREPVLIELDRCSLVLRHANEFNEPNMWWQWGTRRFGLFEYYKLCEATSTFLLANYGEPEGIHWFPGKHRWLVDKVGRGIGKRLHAQWKRLLGLAEPTVVEVQRRVFSATLRAPAFDYDVYKDKYVVSDILRYRAAAIAAAYARGGDMADWRKMYAPGGLPYRSLNKTLDNFPGGIGGSSALNLRWIELERPVTDRVELAALLEFAAAIGYGFRDNVVLTHNSRAIMRSTRAQVAEAIHLIDEYRHVPCTLRNRDIRQAMLMLADYPELCYGNIVTLAKKTIRWHRHLEQRRLEQRRWVWEPEVAWADTEIRDQKVVFPPIPLPEAEGIKFLDTYDAILREGIEMGHCIGSYAKYAVGGASYLFHIDYNGEKASAEVLSDGRVTQVRGPSNSNNAAVEYGKRELEKWARKLRRKMLS